MTDNNPRDTWRINRRTVLRSAAAMSAAALVGVPASSGRVVAAGHEELYLIDMNLSDQATIYTVSLDSSSGDATLTTEVETGFNLAHIAAAPDGETLYLVSEGGEFGTYDVTGTDEFTNYGPIGGDDIGTIVQAATGPDGTLYAGDKDRNSLYTITGLPGSATATELGQPTVGDPGSPLSIKGADIAFTSDGTLYHYTNDTQQLYTVETSTLKATPVANNTGEDVTGLAVRDDGTGPLVASVSQSDEIIVINRDGSIEERFTVGGDLSTLTYGDMTVGALEQPCVECSEDGALVKYEFTCTEYEEYEYEDTEDAVCLEYDFVPEGESDDNIRYDGEYTNKEGEENEPISVTFETDYCTLDAMVKAGPVTGWGDVELADGEVTVSLTDDFVNEKNDKKYAISYVEFYCPETEAEEEDDEESESEEQNDEGEDHDKGHGNNDGDDPDNPGNDDGEDDGNNGNGNSRSGSSSGGGRGRAN